METGKERERRESTPPICWFISQTPTMAGTGPSQCREPGIRGPNYLSHHCCLQGLHWQKARVRSRESNPDSPMWDSSVLIAKLNACPNVLNFILPQIYVEVVITLSTPNVTLLGNRLFVEVIKLR